MVSRKERDFLLHCLIIYRAHLHPGSAKYGSQSLALEVVLDFSSFSEEYSQRCKEKRFLKASFHYLDNHVDAFSWTFQNLESTRSEGTLYKRKDCAF